MGNNCKCVDKGVLLNTPFKLGTFLFAQTHILLKDSVIIFQ